MQKIPVKCETINAATGETTKTETVDWHLMPAPEGTCPKCAKAHEPHLPHDAQSLQYQYDFYSRNQRWPTWKDAMAHCTPEMQALWTKALKEKGIDVDG